MDSAEKYRVNDAKLENILNELKAREPIFHHPELGTTQKDFENMMVSDYWEVGASGRRYGKDAILEELQRRYTTGYTDDMQATDFHIRELGPDTYLLTYNLLEDKQRKTRRSTIWKKSGSDWKIVFHQGTIASKD
jgi:hypothetical protein